MNEHQPRLPLDWDAIRRDEEHVRRKPYFAEYYQRHKAKKLASAKLRQKETRSWTKTDRRDYWKKRYRAKCEEERSEENGKQQGKRISTGNPG